MPNLLDIAGAAAVVSGAGGGLIGALRLLRTDKYNYKHEQGVTLLTGYEKLVDDLRQEVERLRKRCDEEMKRLSDLYNADRQEWEKDRAEWQAELAILRSRLSKIEKGP